MDNLTQACSRAYNTIMRGYAASIVVDANGKFKAVQGLAKGAIMTWNKLPVVDGMKSTRNAFIIRMCWQVTEKDAKLESRKNDT